MAHFDRGVYEPSDDLRVFDGSEDDEDVEGSRLPLLIVLALLVLAMFAGVVWLAYTQGVARGRTETPVLTAQNGPARIAPQNPGGAEQPYKGFKIYEQPAPPDDDADTVTSRGADPVAPPPAAVPKAVAVAAPAPKPAPVSVVAAPVAPAPAPPVKIAAPVPVKLAPAAVKPPPPVAAKPAAAPVLAKKESPPPSAPVGLATAAPRPLTSMPAAASSPAAAMGGVVLQIGAYKSQAEADAAWKAYKAKHAALLAGATQDVQQADLGDKGTWYRLRLVGFPSKDVALAMCDRLKADGAGCFLGK